MEADPDEEADVAPSHPEAAARLRQELDAAIASWRAWEKVRQAPLSPAEESEIEQRLAHLG